MLNIISWVATGGCGTLTILTGEGLPSPAVMQSRTRTVLLSMTNGNYSLFCVSILFPIHHNPNNDPEMVHYWWLAATAIPRI